MDQLYGNMDAIMEYLRTQKEATTSAVVETPTENVVQPISNQPSSVSGPSVPSAMYPWGMPHNFVPMTANRGAFILYHPIPVHPVNGNFVVHP